jgi:PAS domain S-box-containing protein
MLKRLQRVARPEPLWGRYLAALLLTSLTLYITTQWNQYIGTTRYLFCWVAVIWSAALWGWGPALVSAALSGAGIVYLVALPLNSKAPLWDNLLPPVVMAFAALLIDRLAENKRRAQRELLAITNAIPAGIAYIDRSLEYRFGNQMYFVRFGIPPEQIYGRPAEEILGAKAMAIMLPYMQRALSGEAVRVKVETNDKDGQRLVLQTDLVPAARVRGLVPGFYVLSADVTDQERMHEELRATEEKYRLASIAGHVGLWDWDINHNKVTWSEKIYEFHGVKPGEYDGTVEGFSKLIHPDDAPGVQSKLEQAIQMGGRYQVEFRAVWPNGESRWLAAEAEVLKENGKAVRLLGATIDITERKRAEEKLVQTEERQRRAIEAGNVGLWEWNMVTGQVEWSDHVYGFYGLKRGDFDGTVAMFANLTHPDDRARVMKRLEDAIDGKAPYNAELRVLRPDGQIRWIWTTGDFERDAAGKPIHMRGTALDITERKKWEESLSRLNQNLEREVAARVEELRKKEEELYQVRKLEAIGQLAGGVAHDFNNLMTGILGIAESLHESLPLNDTRRDETEAIIKASQRTTDLTRQLLAFGRRQITHARVIDLNREIQEISKLLSRLIREDIQLEMKLGKPLSIKVDATQLQQILMNLVVNARDAMPNGGRLTLTTAEISGKALLSVSDTGTGMTKEVFDHIFEPFYTTKEPNRGTGLGLATVYGIVKQNGGDIDVKTAPGEGTTFTMYFPITAAPAPESASIRPQMQTLGGGEQILIVEDEDVVRYVIAKKLKQAGYNVYSASNGRDALELARNHMLDLIVTDVIMPEMNGPQVATKVRELHPHIGVLYMSGYPEEVIAHSGVLQPGINFLEKPVVSRQIVQKVREILDNARTSDPADTAS